MNSFIERLNKMSRDDDPLIYTLIFDHHKRSRYELPTEAQWEYAARAGTQTQFYFGDDENQLRYYAWYIENSNGGTQEVAQLRPNAWGLHDMLGNVWEWMAGWYESHRSSNPRDPKGLNSRSIRVSRGGSWTDCAGHCRSAMRYDFKPRLRGHNLGFRLVRTQ